MIPPASFLAMWAAGLAGGGGVVAWWRIVGPGYTWLTAGTSALLAGSAAALGAGPVAIIGVALAAAALVAARRAALATALLAAAAIALIWSAELGAQRLATVTGAAALGAVTSELLLGHWYLVDTKLPRTALRRLAIAGVAATGADALATVYSFDGFPRLWAVLPITALVLLVGVWLSLRGRGYRAVMAATGLSYLALLCVLAYSGSARLLVPGSF